LEEHAEVPPGADKAGIPRAAGPGHGRHPAAGIEFAQVASAPTLGNVEPGVVASLTSLRFSIVSGGILCVAGTIAIGLLLPALARYDAKAARE
jgi:hypothetical protein